MQPLDLHLKASGYLTWAAVVVWGAMVSLLLGAGLPWWQNLATIVLASLVLRRWLQRYAWLQSSHSLRGIRISVHQWRLTFADGQVHDAKLASGCRFLPGFIVLRWRLQSGALIWCLLLADSARPDALRRLRVWGRWGSYSHK
jgi:hypothetical protein